jgi:hypothetical protein
MDALSAQEAESRFDAFEHGELNAIHAKNFRKIEKNKCQQ